MSHRFFGEAGMQMLRTLGWNIADYFIRRSEKKNKGRRLLGKVKRGDAAVPTEVRAGKVLASGDPTGAAFYDEWLPFATSCCLCGEEILPGDGVILCNINEHALAEKATLVGTDHAVGCLRADCCVQAPHYANGFWTKSGYCQKEVFSGI